MNTDPQSEGTGGPFAKVGECLYRHKSSGAYYALVKRGGKQFRRSLKTSDRQLASRRLAQFRDKMNRLNHHGGDSRVTFGELADRWFASIAPNLKRASASRRGVSLKQLKPYFADTPVRNIAAADCDKWVEQRGPLVSASTFNKERTHSA